MANCNNKNPLQHNGSARAQRLLPGLQQGYVNVDEKTFADWIVFAKNFSHYLNYYDAGGAQSGNWSIFFSNDLCALMGDIAVQDVDAYKRTVKNKFDFLKEDDNKTKTAELKTTLNDLFSAVTSFALSLDGYYRLLPAGTALKVLMENIVPVTLAKPFEKLLKYYKAASDLNFLPNPPVTAASDWKVLGSFVTDASLLKTTGLTDTWWKHSGEASWSAYYLATETGKDESIFGDPAWTEYERMNHAANHNLFAAIFQQFLLSYSRLVSSAEKELLASLEKQNDHAPHYALFLAFLKLFRLAQNDINSITQRHLDFYYKEVLQLKQKTALPNSAHIIAELSKPVDDFVLPKGSLLKAGKDGSGKEVLYAANNETVFNKAVIASLRAVYFGERSNADDITGTDNDGRLFAAPVINSADGTGAELTTVNKEWHPFVNKEYGEGILTAIKMPRAQIGFAVASHYLYLQEGKRKVFLRMAATGAGSLSNTQFSVYLTIEKKWYKVPAADLNLADAVFPGTTEACKEISFTLAGDVPAIVNYNTVAHGGTLNVNVPVLKLLLVNDNGTAYQYNNLKNITLTKLQLEVNVGKTETSGEPVNGVKNLMVLTGAGQVDVSKPFQPFGAMPEEGAEIVIGNKEIFSKPHAKIRLNMQWLNKPGAVAVKFDTSSSAVVPQLRARFLRQGIWSKKDDAEMDMPNVDVINAFDVENFVSPEFILPVKAAVAYEEPYTAFNSSSSAGFFKFILRDGFGHKAFMVAQSVYLIKLANTPTVPVPPATTPPAPPTAPVEPYTPVVQSLQIDYTACSDAVNINSNDAAGFGQKAIHFFHIAPFGDAEQHKYLNKQNTQFLLPQFNHDPSNPVGGNAEFYIGIQNLLPGQVTNILFQSMDGTANPVIPKPTDHVLWSYLSRNKWVAFPKQNISDSTMQLIQPGIIQFSIPADATVTNTLLPAGLLWIKASVNTATGAVCKLLNVHAQAAVATFANNNNAVDFGDTALPAQTISKLKEPLAAIKKITQPYSSFGGRPAETGIAFYTRVSERLRHKSRAITIWDYEHLILEAFPLIHKVKCLNHTKSDGTDYNEVAPGHVTVITIPDLKQRNDADLLRPYTSQATIEAIKIFLQKKISCHVQLHVENPDFEQVRMKLKVKLAANYNDFTVYSKKLQEDITAFLSPWAYGASDIGFGGKIYKSELINFIEERPYVDFITNVEMAHLTSTSQPVQADNDDIIATTAKGILVSVPASKHIICNYENNQCTQP